MIRRALAIAPSFGNGYVLLGYVLTHERKRKDAEQAFADARKYGADSPWLQNNEAELRGKLGHQELAEKLYTEIAASPSTPVNAKTASSGCRSVTPTATATIKRHSRIRARFNWNRLHHGRRATTPSSCASTGWIWINRTATRERLWR